MRRRHSTRPLNTHPEIPIECTKRRLQLHIQEQVSVAKQQTITQSHPSNELNIELF